MRCSRRARRPSRIGVVQSSPATDSPLSTRASNANYPGRRQKKQGDRSVLLFHELALPPTARIQTRATLTTSRDFTFSKRNELPSPSLFPVRFGGGPSSASCMPHAAPSSAALELDSTPPRSRTRPSSGGGGGILFGRVHRSPYTPPLQDPSKHGGCMFPTPPSRGIPVPRHVPRSLPRSEAVFPGYYLSPRILSPWKELPIRWYPRAGWMVHAMAQPAPPEEVQEPEGGVDGILSLRGGEGEHCAMIMMVLRAWTPTHGCLVAPGGESSCLSLIVSRDTRDAVDSHRDSSHATRWRRLIVK